MTSEVTIVMVGGVRYTLTLPTEQAQALVRSLTRPWAAQPGRPGGARPAEVHELNLADGARVRVNADYVVAVEVR